MAAILMEAHRRTGTGKGPNRRLRATGKIPGVLYGGGKDTLALSLDPKAIIGIIRSHGGVNTIFELRILGADAGGPNASGPNASEPNASEPNASENVMIREYQLEPVGHELIHADLVRVAMDKELTLDVAIELTGTAVGVKVGGGMLDFVTRTVEVACLPKDIPETIVADVSHLEIGDYIRAGDLSLPSGVKLVSDANVVIAHCVQPKAEEEPKPAEAAVEGAAAPAAEAGAKPEAAPAKEAKEGKDKKEGKD
jgi:large subunit ribosomal protein L25